MSIEMLMTKRVVTVEMDDTLRLVKEIFDQARFHHLLVVQGGKLVGVISDRDLLKEITPNLERDRASVKESAVLNKKAHQIMSRDVVTVSKDHSIKAAIELFLEKDVSCLPVVDDERHIEGLLSWKDIFRYLLTLKTGANDG
ncbi:MAG: CBS domain-containing protein [Gammaproteobacteria bacterium]|nr:CBS domain-containing protein [Gammaproteobacteria bacterium]